MMNLLQQIVERKRREVEETRALVPVQELKAMLVDASEPRGFASALAAPGLRLIAEVKKASPSQGLIRADFDPVKIAQCYHQNGAACVSVLTDGPGFQGSLDDLKAVRTAIPLPALRKDFILDSYQVVEARAAGADCILLIAECLKPDQLRHLFEEASELGMDVLIELYDEANLEMVLSVNPKLVGINNRDLRTFETRLEHTIGLLDDIPDSVAVVSESGIKTRDDIVLLQNAKVDAVLIGETLMRSADPADAIKELFG